MTLKKQRGEEELHSHSLSTRKTINPPLQNKLASYTCTIIHLSSTSQFGQVPISFNLSLSFYCTSTIFNVGSQHASPQSKIHALAIKSLPLYNTSISTIFIVYCLWHKSLVERDSHGGRGRWSTNKRVRRRLRPAHDDEPKKGGGRGSWVRPERRRGD